MMLLSFFNVQNFLPKTHRCKWEWDISTAAVWGLIPDQQQKLRTVTDGVKYLSSSTGQVEMLNVSIPHIH